MIKIIDYIQLKIFSLISYLKGLIYFLYRLLIENKIIKNLLNNIKNFYSGLLLFFLVFFYFYILIKILLNGYNISNTNDVLLSFINVIKSNIELFHKISVILFFLVFLAYLKKIFDFTQKYLINWSIFGIISGINISLFINTGKSIIYDFFVLNYIGEITLSILLLRVLSWEIKMILSSDTKITNKKLIDKIYYLKSFKKIYNKTYKNEFNNFKNINEYITLKYEHYKKYLEESKIFNNIEENYIKPINDDPISLGGDKFFFGSFSKSIFDIINGIDTKELSGSYSIGIVGEWGLGKSSIINLLYEDYIDGREKFIFYKFNPWNYTKENILEKFLTDFSKNLDNKLFSKQILSYLSILSDIDLKFKIINSFLNSFIGNRTLNDVKNEINKYLNNLDKKIIIVIDDLDRCEPDEVIMMLNIIKNLGDFKNVIYLISYDKKHITEVLENKGFEGIYIDKIINVEKYLIRPTSEQLEEYFLREFEKILGNINYIFTLEQAKYLIKENKIIFTTENLRFIKKLLNHINLALQLENNKSKVLRFEVNNFSDLILINYIKLKDYIFFTNVIYILYSSNNNLYYNKDKNPLITKKINDEYVGKFLKFLSISKFDKKDEGIVDIRSSYNNFSLFLNQLDSTRKSFELNKETNLYKNAEKQYLEEKRKYEILKENVDFVNNFS